MNPQNLYGFHSPRLVALFDSGAGVDSPRLGWGESLVARPAPSGPLRLVEACLRLRLLQLSWTSVRGA